MTDGGTVWDSQAEIFAIQWLALINVLRDDRAITGTDGSLRVV